MSADGIAVEAPGLKQAISDLTGIARRLADPTPVMRYVMTEFEKRTLDAWINARSQFGVPFAPLAESTVRARIRKLSGANKRTKSGALTKAAQRKRAAALAPVVRDSLGALVSTGSANKPLEATGFARRTQRWVLTSPTSITFMIVDYMLPSLKGGQRGGRINMPPQRNPTVFLFKSGGGFDFLGGGGSDVELDPSAELFFRTAFDRYVMTGKAA